MGGADEVEEVLRGLGEVYYLGEIQKLRGMGYRVIHGSKGGKDFFFARKRGKPVIPLLGFHKFLVRRLRGERGGGWTCFYCPKPLQFDVRTPTGKAPHDLATLEHRLCRARGGTYKRTNLALTCGACNKDKNDLPEDTFIKLRVEYGMKHKPFRDAQRDFRKSLQEAADGTI